MSGQEEADLVLRHLGLSSTMLAVVNHAKVVCGTELVEYEMVEDPEADAPSTLAIHPIVSPRLDFDARHAQMSQIHNFIRRMSEQLYTMSCVNVQFRDERGTG